MFHLLPPPTPKAPNSGSPFGLFSVLLLHLSSHETRTVTLPFLAKRWLGCATAWPRAWWPPVADDREFQRIYANKYQRVSVPCRAVPRGHVPCHEATCRATRPRPVPRRAVPCRAKTCRAVPGQNGPIQNVPCLAKTCRAWPKRAKPKHSRLRNRYVTVTLPFRSYETVT